jgi:antitoxin YefM
MLVHPKESYEKVKASLDEFCTKISDERGIVIVERDNGKNVALITEDELSSMEETLYLLSSPENVIRISAALDQAKSGSLKSQTIEELFQELGIEDV